MSNQYLTAIDVARRYNISKSMMYKCIRSGLLPRGVYFGKAHRWGEKELEAYEAKLKKGDK